MAKASGQECERVYAVAERWVDAALRNDDSLLTPGVAVWSQPVIDDLIARFVDNPDESSQLFLDKLRGQLLGADPLTIQLAGEVLYIYFLISLSVGGHRKREVIREVLSWSPEPVQIPDDLAAVLDDGICHTGTGYHTNRPAFLRYLILFSRDWRLLSPEERSAALEDPWAFRRLVYATNAPGAPSQRDALLHLVHPETFEDMIAMPAKLDIAKAFADLVDDPDADVDAKLWQIRQKLIPKYGEGFDFWDEEIKKIWRPDETDVIPDGTLAEPFATIFEDYEEAEWAFELLAHMADRLGLTGPDDPRYACTLRYRDRAIHFNFCRWFLAGFYAPGFRDERLALTIRRDRTAFGDLSEERGFKCSPDEPGAAFVYPTIPEAQVMSPDQQAALDETLDYAVDRFESYSATPYRRAHVTDMGKAIFDPEFRQQLLTGKVVDIARADYPLEQMAAETGFSLLELRAWISALQRKKQAILYGPPGTGKTYVARRLAQHLVATSEANDGFLELVQFHPAYAYEDFLQGIRPQTDDDGALSYDLERGRFLEFIDKAREREGTCVLIIDEINRANIARVFGELMYLLEYRDDEIALAGGGTLKIPENVRLIGTMNTADRSIALVDHALRRRFAFLELQPQYHVLTRFHADKATGFPVDELLVVLEKLNGQIRDPHYFVGISFFLDEHLGETIESVWRTEIYPYLDEYFFDQPKVCEQFTWQAVSPQLGL